MTHLKEGHRNLKHGSQRFRVQFWLPGKTKDLPDLRGPFSYPSLTSAQSGDYSLVIVTTFVHYANFHNYFVPGVISGLNSPACMLSAPLEKQLFYYIGTMLPNTRPHSYVFYQLRCHLSYVALSINGDKFQYTGAMTSKFLMGTYKRVTEKGDEHVLSLIFGKTKDLPDLRGPFSYPSLTSANDSGMDLRCIHLHGSFRDSRDIDRLGQRNTKGTRRLVN